jgi:hypothetical protein
MGIGQIEHLVGAAESSALGSSGLTSRRTSVVGRRHNRDYGRGNGSRVFGIIHITGEVGARDRNLRARVPPRRSRVGDIRKYRDCRLESEVSALVRKPCVVRQDFVKAELHVALLAVYLR